MARYIVALMILAMVAIAAVKGEANKCPKNESNNICGQLCEPHCENLQPNPRWCPRIVCSTLIVEKCRCNEGYARNSSGRCIPKSECPRKN